MLKKKKSKKIDSKKKLTKQLDKVFSLYIRNRDRKCYTCKRVYPVSELQCGHYVSRSYRSLRYDERNCHAQCVGCNVFRKGNMTVYAINLVNDYGVDLLREFEQKKLLLGPTTLELKKLIKRYDI